MGNEIKTPSGTNAAPGAPTLPPTFKSEAKSHKGRKPARTGKGPQAPAGDSFKKGDEQPKGPDAGSAGAHSPGPNVPPPSGNAGGIPARGGAGPKMNAQKGGTTPKAEEAAKGAEAPKAEEAAKGAEGAEAPKGEEAPKAEEASSSSVEPKAASNSQYKIVELGNGEFRLQHKKDLTRSYLIQIFPNADLGAADQTRVGEIIGDLLGLLAHEEGNHGGIKSVTFSGNGGQVTYNQHPDGDKPVNFGGDDRGLMVEGAQVRFYLQELDKILKRHSPFQVRLQADDGTKAAGGKKADNESSTEAPEGGASASPGEPGAEEAPVDGK